MEMSDTQGILGSLYAPQEILVQVARGQTWRNTVLLLLSNTLRGDLLPPLTPQPPFTLGFQLAHLLPKPHGHFKTAATLAGGLLSPVLI